jgi:DeoD family purine-nucleoside phosphorylase
VPIHLRPTAPLADRVLLPGDPGRALLLAQTVMSEPRMFNHHRGLWGYTGTAHDGEPLTIQSTGMGGPSAAIVVQELADLGARRIVRVGTCGALADGLALGDLVVAREALAGDGTSRALGAGDRVTADARLTAALERAADGRARTGSVLTTDLFYDRDDTRTAAAGDALAAEMEAATILQLAELLGLRAGCVLAVTDLRSGPHQRIPDERLEELGRRVGRVGAQALLQDGSPARAVRPARRP